LNITKEKFDYLSRDEEAKTPLLLPYRDGTSSASIAKSTFDVSVYKPD